ncbi:hypothetical protein [Mycobacterium decipiens]|nr:hypothetical protein [Mycobacterium decipiens]
MTDSRRDAELDPEFDTAGCSNEIATRMDERLPSWRRPSGFTLS